MRDESRDDIHHRELSTILRFSALISSSLNIEVVLDNAMKWAEEFMDAEASSVYELDEEKNELIIRLARGDKKETLKGVSLKLGEGIAGFVVQTKTPMVVQDVCKEKRFSGKFDKLTGFRTRSMLCVPLILRDKPIGALQVLNKKSGQPFTDTDLELLTSMSQQIAVAIQNAHMYQRLEEKCELTAEELKRAQEELIRSERLAAIGHLVQGVAHEIRNPIMTIGGFAQRIKKELGESHRLGKYADIIMDEAARLETLVRKVRQVAEVQSSSLDTERAAIAISDALKRCEPLAARQGIKLVVDVPQESPVIRMDRHQLATALYNVLENAVESMPNGGSITLKAHQGKNHLLISISDTGCGIPPENLNAVYDPFVTSKARGAGLGLTMVYQIIMNHHGEISISSELDKGTTVNIRLPIPALPPMEGQ